MNFAHQFSVIIPTYNRAERLRLTLESLFKQTYKNFEVLVCDDGSTDNTAEVVESFKNKLEIIYIWEENWGGPARPRNNGIKAAKGEWICFLDSDDWWYPEKLETCLPFLENNDLIYHDLVVSKGSMISTDIIKGRDLVAGNVFLDLLVKRNGIANSSVVVRKELIEQVGYLSEDKMLIAVEDFDLWLRISQITNRFYHVSACLGVYTVGSNNITSDYLKRNTRELYIFKKYESLIPSESLGLAKAWLNFFLAINFALSNDSRYIKSLLQVICYGSFKMKVWAFFNLLFGLFYIRVFHKPVY